MYAELTGDCKKWGIKSPHDNKLEVHAWSDMNLYDVIKDSMILRDQPLNLITTTAGYVREGVFDKKYAECESIINGYDDGNYTDDSVLPLIYELDDANEVHDESTWQKANPTLGISMDISVLRKKYNTAKETNGMPNLLCKHFNIRQNGHSAWLSYEEANNEATFDITELKPKYAIGGVDLSETTDLTSACIEFMLPNDDTVYFKHMYWMLSSKLEERIAEDKVPYDIWVQNGLIRLCDGEVINHKDIVNWFLEVQQEYGCYIYMIGYDNRSASYLVEDLKDNFGQKTVLKIPQYANILSVPMQNLGAMLKANKVNYDNNPVTKWCIMNTHLKTDSTGAIQPQKGSNRNKRIDGLACMLDAYVTLTQNRQDYYSMIGKYN